MTNVMSAEEGAATLLYVEDEFLIRMLVETALCEAGFRVVVAVNGAEALRLLQASGAAFCGLVTDVNLGNGPDGWQVAQRAREKVSGLPVIYVSGASAHEFTSKGVPGSLMIDKPCGPSQILVAVSSLLSQVNDKRAEAAGRRKEAGAC